MAEYLHPGVYIEEITSAARPLQAAGTSTAAFVGDTALDTVLPSVTNKASADTATLIKSWPEYEARFGGIRPVKPVSLGIAPGAISPNADIIIPAGEGKVTFKVEGGTITPALNYTITLTVNGADTVLNVGSGGTGGVAKDAIVAVINSVPNSDVSAVATTSPMGISLQNSDADNISIAITSDISNGGLPGDVTLSSNSNIIAPNNGARSLTVQGGNLNQETTYTFTYGTSDYSTAVPKDSTPTGIVSALVGAINDTNHTSIVPLTAVADGSNIKLTNTTANDITLTSIVANYGSDNPDYMGHSVQAFFNNGGGRAYIYHNTAGDYQDAMTSLEDHRDISLLITPAKTPPTDPFITSHLTKMGNRMWLTHLAEGTAYLDAANNNGPNAHISASYEALYYPWIEVSNPAYDPNIVGSKPSYFIPPTGFVAGNCAQTDSQYGVWHSPAGVRTALIGGLRAQTHITDSKQDELNPKHVNCLRSFNGPLKIWGARTRHDGEWRYISVRRTAMMLEESIYQGMKWAVFQPNDHNLWASLRQNVETFMSGLHDAGAFAGSKASDAFFVRCGLGDTMTPANVADGKVIVEIGFAPVNPAEFVIFRISQIQQIQA